MTFLLVGCLVWTEANYFMDPGYSFRFVPDTDYQNKLSINVDMTVAMPCDCKLSSIQTYRTRYSVLTVLRKSRLNNTHLHMIFSAIGADILDSTNQNTFTFGTLKEENTWFELDRVQRKHFDEIRAVNIYLREEYHAVQELMWKTGRSKFYGDIPERCLNMLYTTHFYVCG